MPKLVNRFIEWFHKPIYPTPYEFSINTGQFPPTNNKIFPTNKIHTTHYTTLTFLPKSLLLQFTRLANCYFLIIAILLSINIISPLNPFTAWAPLLIVIAISIVRQGYQDYQRYKSDKTVNQLSFTVIIRNGQLIPNLKWSQVQVSDICLIKDNQTFPADLLLLKSTNDNGIAFIETASLDGQKSLKPRNAYKQTQQLSEQQLYSLNGNCLCPLPSASLHEFTCSLSLLQTTTTRINININTDKQLLYRGTKLRNTELIYGLVLYTGANTKIMKNAQSKQRYKMSQVQKKVNNVLGIILLIQLTFCFIISIFYGVFHNQVRDQYYYIDWLPYSSAVDSIITFFTYMVLLNTMIPISLIVSIQIVKLFQKYFIDKDKFMYSNWRGVGVKVKSASLNQQLGQVEYVFSDKTGTLTKNIMRFSKAIIGREMFNLKLQDQGQQGEQQQQQQQQENNHQKQQQHTDYKRLKHILIDQRLDYKLQQPITIKPFNNNKNTLNTHSNNINTHSDNIQIGTFRQLAQQYLLALALTHQVVTSQDTKHHYHGPSPDQICLVQTARTLGYEFINSSQSTTTINIFNKPTTYQLLQLISFTSQRKRMSIVLKNPQRQYIRMYIKGADNVIKQRLANDNLINVDEQLTRLSNIGLRTLLIATRIITNTEYQHYKAQKQRILQQIDTKQQPKLLQQLQHQLQSNLYLLGATAVEDDLQDDVPQTIRDLLRANIKVWMLTGDKMETAESVGNACGLIKQDSVVVRIDSGMINNINININNIINTSNNDNNKNTNQNININTNTATATNLQLQLQYLTQRCQQLTQSHTPKCLLIEGTTIHHIVNSNKQTQQSFTHLTTLCESVICCRLLPIQKQSIVNLVRTNLNKITLAIGDGANDITMIKQAHIGIGLYGQQGMGAVQASDYALPQFRMLWRLLFVHGRWNYIRISEMILYFFYKNMLFTIPQFICAFYCGYSGQTVFDDVYVTLYNLIFTALPLIVRAVMEQDVNYMFRNKHQGQQQGKHNNKQHNNNSNNHYLPPPILNEQNMLSQQSHLPQNYHINKYFYRLFPKLYFIGQQQCVFNYRNYFAWLIEGMIQATILTVFTFQILGQGAVNGTGWSSSFWLVGVVIYTSVMFVVTIKLATHTKFWSSILIWTIILTSLGLYLAYTWISNYALSRYVRGVAYVGWTSGQCYFLILFSICMILFVDGIVVWMDFRNGSLGSRLREIVYREKVNDRRVFDQMGVSITSGLTVRDKGEELDGRSQQEKLKSLNVNDKDKKNKNKNDKKKSQFEQKSQKKHANISAIKVRPKQTINNINNNNNKTIANKNHKYQPKDQNQQQ